MNKIENYFETSKLLCKSSNSYIKNNFLNNNNSKKSILLKYKNNLNKLKNNKNNLSQNIILNKLQNIYESLLLDGNIVVFVKNLFELNDKINKKNNNINLKKNPFYKSNYIKLNKLFVSNSNNLIQNINIKKQLNLLVQGKITNTNSPSLGILRNINSTINNKFKIELETTNYSQMTQLFSDIKNIYMNEDKTSNNFFFLPIQNLNLGETLNHLLTNGNSDKILIIIEYVNKLESTFNHLKYLKTNNSRDKKILNPKYVIPYYIKDNNIFRIERNKITSFLKNPEHYFKIYNELFQYIEYNLKNNIIKTNKAYIDKIAYLFLFQHIQIFYDLYYLYIDNITKYIITLKQSNNSSFKNLNFKDCFDYLKN